MNSHSSTPHPETRQVSHKSSHPAMVKGSRRKPDGKKGCGHAFADVRLEVAVRCRDFIEDGQGLLDNHRFPRMLGLAARACFVPIVERFVEGRHALANRYLRNANHVSSVFLPYHTISAELRSRFSLGSQAVKDVMEPLVIAATKVRSLRRLLRCCGLIEHPALQQALSQLPARELTRSLRPLAIDVLMHVDGMTLHQHLPKLPSAGPPQELSLALAGQIDATEITGGKRFDEFVCKYALLHLKAEDDDRSERRMGSSTLFPHSSVLSQL